MNFETLFRVLMIGLCIWMMLGDLNRARTPARIRARHDRNRN